VAAILFIGLTFAVAYSVDHRHLTLFFVTTTSSRDTIFSHTFLLWGNEQKRLELPESTEPDMVVRFVNCCAKSKSRSTAPTDACFAERRRSREPVWAFGNANRAERL
jgi:hypothetical protein